MKLIVLMAFDENEDGELSPAFEAREMRSAEQAVRQARELVSHHAGVLVWQREADPNLGDYGESEILFEHGRIAEME